jgi:hypothetical protein
VIAVRTIAAALLLVWASGSAFAASADDDERHVGYY